MKLSARLFCTVTFLILININLSAQDLQKYFPIADSIVASSVLNRTGYKWLKELCEIGPRNIGSQNLERAIEWAKQKIDSLGFKLTLQPVMVDHWKRGNFETAVISQSTKFSGKKLNISAIGGSVGTPENGITAEVLEVKNFEELRNRKNEANGKIIFFSRPLDPAELNTFAAYGNAVDQRTRGALVAAEYGGVASIIRSVTTKYDTVPHVGAMRNYVDSLPKVPAAVLGYADADFLSNALKEEPSLKLTIKLDCEILPDVQSYNIIADLTGTEKSDEYVIVSGHFDSWDKGDGAHDDGGGCMQALEVLDLLKRLDLKPKRTIRCILYINEEHGLDGGYAYASLSDSLKLINYAAIESDRGVFTPRGFTADIDSANLSVVLNKMQSWVSILNKAKIEWIKKGGSGADISRIKNSKALIGYVPDDARYFDLHHSDNDVFEEVNPREMQLGAAAMAILAYLISEVGLE